MANQSVLELAVGTGKWDAGLKKAKSALDNFTQANGGLQQALGKESQKMQQFVRMMGGMESTAKTAKGQMNDYKGTIEQLTMQYNRMTEAQKKTIGQDYLQAIEQMKQKYQSVNKEIQDMNRSLNNVKAPDVAEGVKAGGLFGGGKLDGMLQVFGGNLMTKGVELATGAVTSLISETGDMIRQGVELAKAGEGIRIAFERLGNGQILQGLREATHGTVTDLELMKAAVKFNDFKLPLEELGTMLAFAQQKAKDTGQSVDYMVDSIVTGLGRKSLMILDNLGLSATEVRERMKETGDMTKAVGAIIREQMAKAGDYVETAADRAAKADVDLKNAMEDLGRTFQPLTNASDSLWNSIKVGALNALNTAVKPLIQALAEAGALGSGARATAGFNRLGGGSKVDRMIGRLGNGKTAGAYSIYTQQLGEFDKYINNKRFQIAAYGSDNSSVAQSAKQRLQAELDGALKMRAEYVKRAQELHNKVPSPFEPATTSGGATGGGGRSGGGSGSKGFDISSIAFDPNKALLSAVKGADTGPSEIWKAITQGAKESTNAVEQLTDAFEALNKAKGDANTGKIAKDGKVVKGSFNDAAGAVGSLGSALAGLDDPAAKIAGVIAQSIANVALAFSSAQLKDGESGNVWYWIAAVAAGAAAMVSTIATIHSATGYANGGVVKAANGAAIPGTFTVPGTTYSNDQIPAMLNAGETVLTRAQAGNIASQLQGAGGSINLNGVLSGENIFLSADRYARRSGRGELVTFHR